MNWLENWYMDDLSILVSTWMEGWAEPVVIEAYDFFGNILY